MKKMIDMLKEFKNMKLDDLCKNKMKLNALLDELGEQLEREGRLYIQTYYDLKMYDALMKYMPAYDITFIRDKGIPYLKAHNPVSILFLDVVVVFYSLVVFDLLIDKTIIVDDALIDYLSSDSDGEVSVFDYCWSFLNEMMRLGNKHERTIYPYGYELYVPDENYLLIEKTIRRHFDDSYFEKALGRVLGNYRMRFSYVMYSQESQSMFIHIANDYKNVII
jgi:hypothetical protein